MKTIPREARRVTYSSKIRVLKTIPFNEVQRAIIAGCVLGDGYLESNWSKTNYRLNLSHSSEQKEYLLWKISIFRKWIISEPYYHKGTNSFRARTISHPELTLLRQVFYRDGKKTITDGVLKFLNNPQVIAVWFMDDGNVVRTKHDNHIHVYHLNTQSFSENENEILKCALNKIYGLKCTVQNNHGYCRIFIRAQSREKFRTIIGGFIVPSMRYKL